MNASTPYTDINEAMLEIKRLREQLDAERERADHYEAVAQNYLNTHQTLVEALKRIIATHDSEKDIIAVYEAIDAAKDMLAKTENQPVQLPMINDDPVVELK